MKKTMESKSSLNRRDFLTLLAKYAAAGTGLLLSIPCLPSEFVNVHLYAAALEWRNRKSSMGYRRLGKTNIMVSEISFGCAINYGCNALGNELTDAVRELYDTSLEAGINFFDSAPGLKSGYTREECFRHFRPVRDNVFLATKVDDFEPDAVRASIERSLKRMDTDYIDIVFLHNMMNRGGWDKGVRALEEIRKMIHEGKVRFSGVSDHSYSNLMKIDEYKDLVDVLLLKYSVKNREKAENVLARAKSLDIGTFAMKVFKGAYECWSEKKTGWEEDGKLQSFLSGGVSVPQAAIRFALNNRNLSSALIGMRSKSEIIENAGVSAGNVAREHSFREVLAG